LVSLERHDALPQPRVAGGVLGYSLGPLLYGKIGRAAPANSQ
jgi:hypothetical protein